MTEEFKSTLFSYLTGKLPNEQGTTEETFKEINDIPRTSWENNGTLPSLWNDFKYEGLIQAQNSDLLVLYGGYKTSDNQVRGIVTILNNDFTPVKTFFQFDSGTYLRYIQCMRQDRDGTFYAVDCLDFPDDKEWSLTTSQKRFIMLNNFTQQINNNYILSLQKSYILPSNYFNFYCRKLFKDIESSHYVMVGNYLRDQSSPDFDGVRIIELKVNVGSENEWNKIDDDGQGWLLGDSYVDFKDDNFYLKILLNNTASSSRELYLWTKDYSQSNPTLKSFKTFEFHPYVDSSNYQNQSVFINKNELYFVQNNQRWGRRGTPNSKYIGLYYYNDETTEFKIIYEKYLGNYDFCNLEGVYITQNNNDLYIQYNNNIKIEDFKADYYFQRLISYDWKPILISKQQYFVFDQRALYVNNNYNLLNWFAYATNPRGQTWKIYNIKENYNSSNYNGEPYVNDNALIPNSAEIYSNESLVFARNLYNKTINNNVTVSTVEVPNNYLNDVDITSKNLLSETNLTMIADTNVMQKNVYETVFLNFINAVQVLNKDIETINRQAGVYLNAKINDEKGYDNAKITKVRIRNMEGTETVQSVQIDYPDETVSSTNPQLTNSANAELNSIKIDGKTMQNGTPTPNDPVEIKNVKGNNSILKITSSNGTDTNSIFLNLKDNELAENDFVKIANNYGTIYKTKETLELTGDENWTKSSSTSIDRFILNSDIINLKTFTKDNVLSTHFIFGEGKVGCIWSDFFGSNNTARIIIDYSNPGETTLEQFKQWLANQKEKGTPVTVQYDLETPYTVDLGMQDNLDTYEGTTNISVDDELTPNIEVNYRLDGNYCILTVSIKVKEPLYQLEFISNDETNVYHTVDLSNLEVGKYYVIKEKLEVL